MADAQARAAEIRADPVADGAQPIVPGHPAAGLHPESAGRQVELIVEHHHVLGLQLEEVHGLGHGLAALVHVGLRLQDQDVDRPFGRGDRALPRQPQEARALVLEAVAPGDGVDGHEAEVVAVQLVLRAGVAEAGQDQHGGAGPGAPARLGRLAAGSFLAGFDGLGLQGGSAGDGGQHELGVGVGGHDALGHGH